MTNRAGLALLRAMLRRDMNECTQEAFIEGLLGMLDKLTEEARRQGQQEVWSDMEARPLPPGELSIMVAPNGGNAVLLTSVSGALKIVHSLDEVGISILVDQLLKGQQQLRDEKSMQPAPEAYL